MVCGYVHSGDSPPSECPVCGAPWAAFDRQPASEPQILPAVVSPRSEGYRYVVIGNSSAGRSAAHAIRQIDKDAEVTVISDEPVAFYYRPILPDFIGGMPESKVFRAAKGVYSDDGLKLVLGCAVTAIDVSRRVVICASGEETPFDSLLIASGSMPVTVPWPGSEMDGITYFRSFNDAAKITRLASTGSKALVVGGGLLGLEFVRAFLARGLKVTMLVRDDRVGSPGLDRDAGSIIERRLSDLSVLVILNDEVKAFEGSDGRVQVVRTAGGREIESDVVGVAIGARSRIDFLKDSGIAVDRGVLVNDRFETNVPGIFAAGDAAQAFDLVYRMPRIITSWRNSRFQGETAGFNMAGADVRCPGVIGSNFQVFGDIPFVSIGVSNPDGDGFKVEQNLDASKNTYRKIVTRDGAIVGAVLVGDTTEARRLENEILRGAGVVLTPEAGIAGSDNKTEERNVPVEGKKGISAMRKMTEDNLGASLAGESQAHIKYAAFSEKAGREGKPNVARLFAAASYAEQVHATAHLRTLKGIGSTSDNLAAAINGEGFEIAEMYPAYIAVAEEQEEKAAKNSFFRALEAEKVHKELYTKAKEAVDAGSDAEIPTILVCSICGFTMEGDEADSCPLCGASGEQLKKF